MVIRVRERTKEMFADKLQEMAKQKSIQSIQVKELCEACGVERSTFYYHFQDKYELVAWIFNQIYKNEAQKARRSNDEAMLRGLFRQLEQKRTFFLNALQDTSQNNLRQYIVDFYVEYERKIVRRYLQTDVLDEMTEYAIRQNAFGGMYNMIEWLQGKTNYTAEKIAHYQYIFMPDILRQAIECDYANFEE